MHEYHGVAVEVGVYGLVERHDTAIVFDGSSVRVPFRSANRTFGACSTRFCVETPTSALGSKSNAMKSTDMMSNLGLEKARCHPQVS